MSRALRNTHRLALELEVVQDPDAADPEDWDVQHLQHALRAGSAKLLRTIQGLVIDSEHDRLSGTLDAVADDLDEAVQLHWLASAKPWSEIASALHPRPSIEAMVELELLVEAVRLVSSRLQREGL